MNYSAILTDFYQLSMAYGYWQLGMHNDPAVFHLFFRRNPLRGDYVIAAGLQTVIDFLKDFHFTESDIDYLAAQKNLDFSPAFLTYLKNLRFTGDIDAVPEGTVVFANEPLLRIRAPLLLCQLLETPLINAINFSSVVATMASRMRHIVGESDALFEFGLRRAQGPDGGLTASRAAFLGGFDATSNVLAGKQFHIPVVGTMAHSWVMAFDDEISAFSAYANAMPENVVLLVDTYDTLKGVDNAIVVGKMLSERGVALKGIRLDSGDLSKLAFAVREKLNHAGFFDTKIMVSGDLNEARMANLKNAKAPIDGWGIGTHLSTSSEQPSFDMVYKLGAIQKNGVWQCKLKCSDNRRKTSDPGILQVARYYDETKWCRDSIYHELTGMADHFTEKYIDLLIPIFRNGAEVAKSISLSDVRKYCLSQLKQFHASKGLGYNVARDKNLLSLKQSLLELVCAKNSR